MTINFYLNDENETEITSFYDMKTNPFALNDIVHLDVDDLYPADYDKYTPDYRAKLITNNEELINSFRHKDVRLVKEYKSVRFNKLKEPVITIEYHCELIY